MAFVAASIWDTYPLGSPSILAVAHICVYMYISIYIHATVYAAQGIIPTVGSLDA